MAWYDGMVWYGMVWYDGMVWYGMVWYGMTWNGMRFPYHGMMELVWRSYHSWNEVPLRFPNSKNWITS